MCVMSSQNTGVDNSKYVTCAQFRSDRDSNPGHFTYHANTTVELSSHLVISPTTFNIRPNPITFVQVVLN